MTNEKAPKDPLHGLTLKAILEDMVNHRGWPWLAEQVPLRCFSQDPSIGSSLRFLRQTSWARTKVERLYLSEQRRVKRNARRKWRAAAKRAHDAAQGAAHDDACAPDVQTPSPARSPDPGAPADATPPSE